MLGQGRPEVVIDRVGRGAFDNPTSWIGRPVSATITQRFVTL